MTLREVERTLNRLIETAEERTGKRSFEDKGTSIFTPGELSEYDRLSSMWYEMKEDEFYHFGGGGGAGCLLPAETVFDGAW